MQSRVVSFIIGVVTMLLIWSSASSLPVSKPEVVSSFNASHSMMDIPQWHCLRYFKHDVHLMRRCRNHRIPLMTKPKE